MSMSTWFIFVLLGQITQESKCFGRGASASKEVEEKIKGGILHRNILSIANDAIAAVPDCPVIINFPHIGVAVVSDGAVAIDFTNIRVVAVAHFTITVDFPNQMIAAIADIAVAVDSADIGVASVAHSAVILNFGYHRIVLVAYGLGLPHLCSA